MLLLLLGVSAVSGVSVLQGDSNGAIDWRERLFTAAVAAAAAAAGGGVA